MDLCFGQNYTFTSRLGEGGGGRGQALDVGLTIRIKFSICECLMIFVEISLHREIFQEFSFLTSLTMMDLFITFKLKLRFSLFSLNDFVNLNI